MCSIKYRIKTGSVTIENCMNFLVSVTAFIALDPFIIWKSYQPHNYLLYPVLLIVTSIVVAFNVAATSKVYKNGAIYFIYLLLFFLFQHLHTSSGGVSIEIGFSLILCIIFGLLLCGQQRICVILKYFTVIFAVSLIPAIIFSVLYAIKIHLDFSVLYSNNVVKGDLGFFYRHYFGCVFLDHEYNTGYLNQYKICGMFDEPGTVGTIGALLLIGNDFWENKNNKWLRIILLGGIMSFSLAFYILMMIYVMVKCFRHVSYRLNRSRAVLFLIGTIAAITVLLNSSIGTMLYSVIFQKMGRAIVNIMYGSGRLTEEYKTSFIELLHSSYAFFGLGYGAKQHGTVFEGSLITDLVVEYGLFGTLLFLMIPLLALLLLCKRSQRNWLFLFALFMSMYQRPQIFNLTYMIIILGSIKMQRGNKSVNKMDGTASLQKL